MEDIYRPNKILILSSLNYEKWFAIIQAKLQSKGGTYILERSRAEYLVLFPEDGAEYNKLEGTAKQFILEGVDAIDFNLVINKDTAREQWEALKGKYIDNRKQVVAHKQKELVNYVKKPGHTIQDTWAALHKIRSDIIAIRPALKHVYSDEELLYRLYDSLPPEYAVTVATLKAREETDTNKVLRILQEAEDSTAQEIPVFETGMVARKDMSHQRPYTPQRSTSRPSFGRPSSIRRNSGGAARPPRCYICEEEGHKVQDCDAFEAIKALVRTLKKGKTKRVTFSKAKKGHKAYKAGSDSSSASEEDSTDEDEEIAHITKEVASKLAPSSWIFDTAASSCMTDKIQLFSGPLKRMKRRTIKVGGGVLYADLMGTVIFDTRRGKPIRIERVYYVPDLGANLLSSRRLCMLGMKGRFDSDSIYLHIDGKDVLKATHQEGAYVLTWISSKFPSAIDQSPKHSSVIETACITIEKQHDDTAGIDTVMADTNEKEGQHNIRTSDTHDVPIPSEMTSDLSIRTVPGYSDEKLLDQPNQIPLAPTDEAVDEPQSVNDYFLMHRRFAHFGSNLISKLHKVTTHRKIRRPKTKPPCPSCSIGKMKKKINREVVPRKDEILDLISIDACGPLPFSLTGNSYFLQIVDNRSRKTWIICTKDRKSIVRELNTWKKVVELQSNKKLKAVRLDNAKELLSIVNQWVKECGLILQDTEPYTSHQNGIAERSIQTTEGCIRAMLHDAELPIEFWDEAAIASSYLKNRVPTGPVTNEKAECPEQVWTGKTPSIDHIRVWGCKCFAKVNPDSHPPGTRQDKLMPVGREAVLMGFDPETTKQYRIYAPDLGRCIKSSSVNFDEDTKGGQIDLKLKIRTPNELLVRNGSKRQSNNLMASAMPTETVQTNRDTVPPTPLPLPALKLPIVEPDPQPPVLAPQQTTSPVPQAPPSPPLQAPEPPPFLPPPRDPAPVPPPPRPNLTAASIPWLPALKRKRDEDIVDDDRVSKHIKALLAMKALELEDQQLLIGYIPIPTSYEEAINDPDYGPRWLQACNNEIAQLEGNNTYIAEVPPKGANVVTCRWVFAIKYQQDGTVEKFKARLVARGFSQIHGIDYDETFAPTVRMDTMRAVLALIAIEDLETGQIDVNNAFTEASLSHLIYMEPPPGMDVKQGEYLRLLQSLYGLKQAAHDWYFTCNGEMTKLGFISSESDPCMYINKERKLIVLVYVDDISIAARSQAEVAWFKTQFAKVFKIKDLGEMTKILGIEIERDRPNKTIRLSQTGYIKKVLKGLDMEQDTHHTTDIPLNGYDNISPAAPNEERVDRIDYSRVNGQLMHTMVYTRPDIAFTLCKLSQFMGDPTVRHAQGMKHLLRYLRSHPSLCITYCGKNNGPLQVVGYSDADYAADKSDRKCTMGQVFMLAGGPISWASRKQRSVSTSTTEAEYMALSECSRQSIWLANLFTELGYPGIIGPVSKTMNINTKENPEVTMELKGDNNGAIALVKNRQVSERSKHIDVAYHYIRELQQKRRVNVSYVPTNEMVADGLTKPLAKQKFQQFIEMMGMKTKDQGEQ